MSSLSIDLFAVPSLNRLDIDLLWSQRRFIAFSFGAMTSFGFDASRETFLLKMLNKRAMYVIIALFRRCVRNVERL